MIGHPVRSRIPIWVAALGEKNVAMTAEVADGWLPLFFVPEKAKEVFGPALAAGTARRDRRLTRCRSPPVGSWPSARSPRWRPPRARARHGGPLYRRHGRQR